MPRFIAKPVVVEATRYTGNLSELPQDLIGHVVSGQSGGMAQVRVYYSPRPVDCEPGDWILRTIAGVAVMREGPFVSSYDEIPAGSDPISEAVALVTYNGGPDPEAAHRHIDWQGHRFPLNEPIAVANPLAVALIRKNAHFTVQDRPAPVTIEPDDDFPIIEDPTNGAGDAEQLGGPDAAEVGRSGDFILAAASQRIRADKRQHRGTGSPEAGGFHANGLADIGSGRDG